MSAAVPISFPLVAPLLQHVSSGEFPDLLSFPASELKGVRTRQVLRDRASERRPGLSAAHSALLSHVVPASKLGIRAPAVTVSTGIAEVDALTGGLPRGALTEICGSASSGRTSLLLSLLAEMTHRQEACALVDASDSFHPASAAAAGVDLKRLLWIRCGSHSPRRHRGTEQNSFLPYQEESANYPFSGRNKNPEYRRLEQALKATDLLLQGGGFGLVVMDLADIAAEAVRRIPLTSWFRFRRAVESTPTVLLVLEQEPFAKTCASLVLKLKRSAVSRQLQPSAVSHQPSGKTPTHAQLIAGMRITAEVVRSRVSTPANHNQAHCSRTERKPPQSTCAQFNSRAVWSKSQESKAKS
jgi:hypothetical protein